MKAIAHLLALSALLGATMSSAVAQTAFLNFDTPGQYTSNFNPWQDVGGGNNGNYDFQENATAGVLQSGAVAVYQSTDTTATYKNASWNFATNNATIFLSLLLQANGMANTGDKIQMGLINTPANGLNNNSGVAFESFRFFPNSATSWSLHEQYRSGGTLAPETVLGNVPVVAGEWYKWVIALTNTSGPSGNLSAACFLYDYGANGVTPGANLVTFSTLMTHTAEDIATNNATWPALRAFQDAGIAAWDNFLVYTPASLPVFTLSLTNQTIAAGSTASFQALADGPGSITYAWYTNGVLVPGVSVANYTTPPVFAGFTNIQVVAANSNGSVTNTASVSLVTPIPPAVVNLPATFIQANLAVLNGQVTATGTQVPTVTLFYGPADGSNNPSAWAYYVSLGTQSGTFSTQVYNLNPTTTYYFSARAVNNAGTAWAAPSQSFTTGTSNASVTGVAVLTQHNDLSRTGANLNETTLNVSNVTANLFGLLWSRVVDDQIYAQPLIMTNVSIPGKGTHNLVIVPTVNDSIYAFDADDSTVVTPYWQTNFVGPNAVVPRNTDLTGACGGQYMDFSGHIGIVSTPVIDPSSGTIYLVARTIENGSTWVQRLHALDIRTGMEKPNSPVIIYGSVTGSGDGNVNGVVTFDPEKQNQRSALALVNGVIYISWSSHCDWGPYHGWVMGFDATTLAHVVTFNDTPNGYDGGIWMSGQAPAADTNDNLYISIGNGTVDTTGGPNRGESFLKLTRSGSTLNVASWFTPYNYQTLENNDLDLGSAGILLVPNTSLAVSGGKQGVMYVVNRDKMGGLSQTSADTNIIQSISVSSDEMHGGPVWWDGPTASWLYVWPASTKLQQYQFNPGAGNLTTPALAVSPTTAPNGQPGGILSVSANGSAPGSGILWAVHQLTGDANQSVQPGILHAYNAQNISVELWNSQQLPARDGGWLFAKFVPPTVANGKVYLSTFSNKLNVFGLLPPVVLNFAPGTGHQFQLTWTHGTLQSSGSAAGSYTNVPGATSPYTISPSAAQLFYRVKVN